jgi:hypothetical protein
MLLSVPAFTVSTYFDDNTSYEIPLKILSNLKVGDDSFNLMFKSFVER